MFLQTLEPIYHHTSGVHKESHPLQKFWLEPWASQRPMVPMMRCFVECARLLHDVSHESEASLLKRLKQKSLKVH